MEIVVQQTEVEEFMLRITITVFGTAPYTRLETMSLPIIIVRLMEVEYMFMNVK